MNSQLITILELVISASFGSVWVDTSGNLVFYSTVANPGYTNWQLVIPLVND